MLLSTTISAAAAPAAPRQSRQGATYQLIRDVETAERGSDGSTSSSTDRDTLIETILQTDRDGVELAYDLPKSTPPGERADNWQFPLRVRKSFSGSLSLLNEPEIVQRIDAWLKKGGMTRAACGHWIFTWNAFKIECDPQSALETVRSFDLGPTAFSDGLTYQSADAEAPIVLHRIVDESDGVVFAGSGVVDADRARHEQAESDVVVAEISRKTLSLDDALRTRAKEQVSGTISVAFNLGRDGSARRRTTITKIRTTDPAGVIHDRTVTETLTRERLADE